MEGCSSRSKFFRTKGTEKGANLKILFWKVPAQLFFFHLILLPLFPFLQVFLVVFHQSFCISYGSWVKFNCCKIDQKKVLVKLLQLYHAVTNLVHYFFLSEKWFWKFRCDRWSLEQNIQRFQVSYVALYWWILILNFSCGCHFCYRTVVEFTYTGSYAINAFLHQCCKFDTCQWRGGLDATVCDKVWRSLGKGWRYQRGDQKTYI